MPLFLNAIKQKKRWLKQKRISPSLSKKGEKGEREIT